MILAAQQLGSGPPIVILHGLFGEGDNWRSVAKHFSERFQVVSLDLRNHGASGWSDEMGFAEMAGDVFETVDHLGLEGFTVLGHSLGGKVAMTAAATQPERIRALVVVDIAPREYRASHEQILTAMTAVSNAEISSRKEADAALLEHIPDAGVRAFLLKSLKRRPDGTYGWKMNLEAIQSEYKRILKRPAGIEAAVFNGATLFLGAERSDYLDPARDGDAIKTAFPAAEIEMISESGHWVHAERPEEFLRRVDAFLTRSV